MLTPAQDKEILACYNNQQSIRGVSRKMGHNQITVRAALVRQGVKFNDNEAVADVVIKKLEASPTVYDKDFEYLSRALGASNVVGVLKNPERFKETVLSQVDSALLKTVVALNDGKKLEGSSPAALANIAVQLARFVSGEFKLTRTDKQPIDSDKVIESINICIKRMRTFNPVLAKETSDAVDGIINIPKSAYKELNGGNNGSLNPGQN